jgi:hypothetical protein
VSSVTSHYLILSSCCVEKTSAFVFTSVHRIRWLCGKLLGTAILFELWRSECLFYNKSMFSTNFLECRCRCKLCVSFVSLLFFCAFQTLLFDSFLNFFPSRATNPSQFDIEFFVNDLSKPGASTFESLGGLEYKQNVNIQLECDRRVSSISSSGA